MAIGVYFHPAAMTTSQYDEATKRLEAAGQGAPPGRLHHSCFGPEDQLMVYDVWDSQESFEEFGRTLMPILGQIGIDVGEPQVMPIHNMLP